MLFLGIDSFSIVSFSVVVAIIATLSLAVAFM